MHGNRTSSRRTAHTIVAAIMLVGGIAIPDTADAQILRRIKNTAKQAAEGELLNMVDGAIRSGIRDGVGCVFSDLECIRSAEEAGEDVYLVDEDGNVLTDDDGRLMTDPEEAAEKATSTRPGEGAWANYDFVPGERVLFLDDFGDDNVGDFPRRLEFVKGGMEVVEWEGRRLLRVTGRDSRFAAVLSEVLPEKFTVEFDAYVDHPNTAVVVSTYEMDPRSSAHVGEDRPYFFFDGAAGHASGIHQAGQQLAAAEDLRIGEELVTVRIMVDGRHAKVYMNERRLANHPSIDMERSDRIEFAFPFIWADQPGYVGNLRVAAGGKDLYDRLAEDGRVSTQGIYFDTGSSRIRPESTPTLVEMGLMLEQHADLTLSIEGHTDDVGDDAFNLGLSEERAQSVRRYLIREFQVDEDRLEAAGLGESVPVDSNDTPEGRQNNRRVELVKTS